MKGTEGVDHKVINATTILKGTGWALGFILVLTGINAYVERIVERKINTPETVAKIRAQVRPIVIFDENESILVDSGGMQHIQSISVELDADKKTPRRIIITPRIHLNVPPILESLDEDFVITSRRGKKFQWIYELGEVNRMAVEGSAEHSGVNRFRIEVIQ